MTDAVCRNDLLIRLKKLTKGQLEQLALIAWTLDPRAYVEFLKAAEAPLPPLGDRFFHAVVRKFLREPLTVLVSADLREEFLRRGMSEAEAVQAAFTQDPGEAANGWLVCKYEADHLYTRAGVELPA